MCLTLVLCLAALVPFCVQMGVKEDAEPVQLEEPARPLGAPLPTEPAMPPPGLSSAASRWSDDPTTSELDAEFEPDAPPSELSTAVPPLDGVIEPSVVVDVRSSIKGRIETIAVDRGDYVEAGQALVYLESGVEEAEVAVAEARAEMQGELRSREAVDELSQRRRKRMEQLFRRDAISKEIQDEVETDARVAAHELAATRERREIAALELRRARELLERRRIQSPVSGYVVDRHASPGEVVDEEVILSVAKVDPLRVEVIAPASVYGEIEVGDTAEVVPELPKGARYEVQVTVIDPLIDPASGTFRVRMELPNPDHTIPSGVRCEVRFLPEAETPDPSLASSDPQ